MNLSLNTTSAWTSAALDTSSHGFEEAMPTGDEAKSDQNPFRSHSRPPLVSPKPKLIPAILERSARQALAPLAFMGLVACSANWGGIDEDGDGYGPAQGDCWDNTTGATTLLGETIASEDIHPGATDAPCDAVDQDCDGVDQGLIRYDDIDRDSYGDVNYPLETCEAPVGTVINADDCKDNDAAINPSASEVCDGVDQNCNGEIDEDATDIQEWYTDADGDSYGGETLSGTACEAPTAGDVTNSSDCDDTLADVHPYAEEICNTVDDNCDGDIDEDLPLNSFYTDADADGYGDANTEILDCAEEALDGTVTNATDCDDTDDEINSAAVEVCDGVDNNCDGTVDDDATDRTTFYADADGDGYGDGAVLQEACTRPSGTVTNTNDCDDAAADVHPYATEVCNGVDDDCDGDADSDATDRTTWYADVDGDTYGNAAVTTLTCDSPLAYVANASDCNDTDDEINPAATEVCNGVDDDCDGDADSDATDRTTWYADVDGDGTGNAANTQIACDQPLGFVSDASDCNDTNAETYPGAVEVFDGEDNDCDSTTATDNDISVSTADETWLGESAYDYAGRSVMGVGDVTGDGLIDVAVGTISHNSGTGRVYVVERPGSLDSLGLASVIRDGQSTSEHFGVSVVGADVDGDGQNDLLVGAYNYASGTGRVWVYWGPLSGSSGSVDSTWDGESSGSYAGISLSGLGDWDSDGDDEVLVGTHLFGRAYVMEGPSSGSVNLSSAATVFEQEASGDSAGNNVNGENDINGDGMNDPIISAYMADAGGSDRGAVYVSLATATGTVNLADVEARVAGAGDGDIVYGSFPGEADIDGDGYDDVILGAQGVDSPGTDAGGAYVVLGSRINTAVSGSGTLWTTAAAADVSLVAEDAGDSFGISTASGGDSDGDGLDEVLVGASGASAAYLWYGTTLSSGGTFYADSDADASFLGTTTMSFGIRATGIGDIDGDGLPDAVFSAYEDDFAATDAGALYLFYGF